MPTVEELQAQVDTLTKERDAIVKERDDLKGGIHPSYEARLKNEAANYRTQLDAVTKERDELKKKADDTERAELEKKGEYEKAREKLEKREREIEREKAELKAANDKRYILAEAKAAAVKLGILDAALPDLATVDLSDLKIAEDGAIAGLEDKIKAIKESKPHWFKAEGQGGEGGGGRAGASPGAGAGSGGTKDLGVTDWSKLNDAELDSKLNDLLSV